MECESEFVVEIDPEWDEDYASHVKLEPVDDDFMDCSREDSYMVNCDDSVNDEHSTVFAVDPNDEHSTVFAVDPEFNCELDNVLPMDHKVRIQSDHNYCTKMLTSSTEMAFKSSDSFHPWTEDQTTPTTQNDSFSLCCVLCRPSRFSCISLLLKHYLQYHRIQPSSGVQGDLVTHLNLLQRVQKLNTIKIGSTYSIDRNEYYCPCCADTFLDYNGFLQHLTHRTEDCCGRGKDVSARQRPATRTTTLADDVTGNDVTTPGNDVTTAGEDVPTPTGNDATTSENDATTTGDDVPTPGNVLLPESDVNAARYGVTSSLGEQNLNLFACATSVYIASEQLVDEPLLPVASRSSSCHETDRNDENNCSAKNVSRTEINGSSNSMTLNRDIGVISNELPRMVSKTEINGSGNSISADSNLRAILNKYPRICPETQETVLVEQSPRKPAMRLRRVSLRCVYCKEVMNRTDVLRTHVQNCKAIPNPGVDKSDPEWEASDSDDSSTGSPTDEPVAHLPDTNGFTDHSFTSTKDHTYKLRPHKLSYTPSPYEDHNYCNGLPHSRSKSLKIEKRVSRSMPELEVLDEAAMQESDEEIDVFAPLMMSN